ncbi:FA71D protein, partial [Zapornia atra]|nr:FA71D protein [Zapornia atra]
MNKKFDFQSISSSQAYVVGNLQRLLSQGEYHPFTSVLLFESKFVEVNERGESISLHNRPSYVTIGICAASPSSTIPNAMLIAREEPVSLQEIMANFWKLSEQLSHVEHLVLTRLFPLTVVELSVHSTNKHHLMLKLVNGHSHYLELCAPPDQQQHLFHQWLQLISLLKKQKNTGNTEVNVKSKDFVMHHKGPPRPNYSSENRDRPQGVTNPKTEEKVVTKQSFSKQVALSGTVGTTEEGERKGQAFHSSLQPTRQETTLQSNNIDPLDTKKSNTTENRKAR